MVIFKKKKQERLKQSKKVVGAYIPCDLAEYLALYGLAYEISIGNIVGGLIEKWQTKQALDKAHLVLLITKSLNLSFSTFNEKSKSDFLFQMTRELKAKGISDPYITEILTSLKNGKNQEKNITGL